MARTALATLSLALGLCTGCFVFDEIDQGRELMKKHSGGSPHANASPAPAPVPDEEEEGPGLLARVQQFIEERRHPAPPERDPDDGIVSCNLEDGPTFTHESDCLSRGGRIL